MIYALSGLNLFSSQQNKIAPGAKMGVGKKEEGTKWTKWTVAPHPTEKPQ